MSSLMCHINSLSQFVKYPFNLQKNACRVQLKQTLLTRNKVRLKQLTMDAGAVQTEKWHQGSHHLKPTWAVSELGPGCYCRSALSEGDSSRLLARCIWMLEHTLDK